MRNLVFAGISTQGVHGQKWRRFLRDLWSEIQNDYVFNGAAALGYYLMLAIFPAMIFLLSLIPYLPLPNLQQSIMGFLYQALPGDAARFFQRTVNEIVAEKRQGLLSFGALFTLWAASSGMSAIIQQLNITYDVKESRSFLRLRSTALLLTFAFGALVVASLTLILAGESLQSWLASRFGWTNSLLVLFAIGRWLIVAVGLSLAFALTYYFGPDVEQKFRFVTPGSVFALVLLVAASLGFKFYVENFGRYNATYGGLGAVIVLMLWLNIMGIVVLIGSEVNALIEHYSPEGKEKGEKTEKSKPSEAARKRRLPLQKGIAMATAVFPDREATSATYGAVLRELGTSAKDLLQSEVTLVKEELKESAQQVAKDSAQAAIYGSLLAMSVLPFLAFLVIGLGEWMGNRYWLSSLIVAVLCAAIGGAMASRAYRKIRDQDLKFTHSRQALERDLDTVQDKFQDVKQAAQRRFI